MILVRPKCVRIVKPGILPDVAQVGIEIERTRE